MSAFLQGPDGAQENVINSFVLIYLWYDIWGYNVTNTQGGLHLGTNSAFEYSSMLKQYIGKVLSLM